MVTILCIIIIFYFENVTFFYAKLGSDVWSFAPARVDNQTFGDTSQDSTRPLEEKIIAISQLSTHGHWGEFLVAGCPSTPNSLDKGKRHWNLETFSAVVEFPPPYTSI